MKMQTWRWAGLALLLLVPAARAQEKAEAPAPVEPHARFTPLRVQIVFSKYQGEKKVASLPYTLTCNAGERQPGVLRMGIEVPVLSGPAKETMPAAFQYKNVGTSIDCRAGQPEDGRYRLELNVEQSSIYSPADEKVTPVGKDKDKDKDGKVSWGVTDTPLGGAPLFRSFRASFVPLLRDGQTVQYTAATDPVSGEVVKIDVTVTVLK